MEQLIMNYVMQAVYTAAVLIVGYLWRSLKAAKNDNQLIKDGLCALLRDKILQRYEQCMNGGYCSIELREDMGKMYDDYIALGGNGVIKTVMAKLKELPTEPSEKTE